jgi:hypothetical protein
MARGRLQTQALTVTLAVGLFLLSTYAALQVVGPARVYFLLAGTGLEGAAAHSVASRSGALRDTFQIFLDSPIIGYSLGGVAAAIGKLHGWTVVSFEDAKIFEGNTVFLEVLAASGMIGFIAFASYVSALIIQPVRLIYRIRDQSARTLMIAMLAALLFELLMLQFNQNILRPYVWIHIALFSALYSVTRYERDIQVSHISPEA